MRTFGPSPEPPARASATDRTDLHPLDAIVVQARQRFDIYDALVVHRVGELRPTDQIVLVAVTGAHRSAAFEACRFIIDYLKTEAPFWKKEQTPHGGRWVHARASDDAALARWRNNDDAVASS